MEDKEMFLAILGGICSNEYYAQNHWEGAALAAKALEVYEEANNRIKTAKDGKRKTTK